ncbi:MAG: hypothetical protein H0X25_20280, partial [Acidobacteriales bacterium]|nr:hypothetical protein [Terriglobales bacterium]
MKETGFRTENPLEKRLEAKIRVVLWSVLLLLAGGMFAQGQQNPGVPDAPSASRPIPKLPAETQVPDTSLPDNQQPTLPATEAPPTTQAPAAPDADQSAAPTPVTTLPSTAAPGQATGQSNTQEELF